MVKVFDNVHEFAEELYKKFRPCYKHYEFEKTDETVVYRLIGRYEDYNYAIGLKKPEGKDGTGVIEILIRLGNVHVSSLKYIFKGFDVALVTNIREYFTEEIIYSVSHDIFIEIPAFDLEINVFWKKNFISLKFIGWVRTHGKSV